MRCPECHALMDEGAIPVHQGLHFLRNRHGRYRDFAENIPGTSAIVRPNDLAAWRCRKCELVVFAYGQRHLDQQRHDAATHRPVDTTDTAAEG